MLQGQLIYIYMIALTLQPDLEHFSLKRANSQIIIGSIAKNFNI